MTKQKLKPVCNFTRVASCIVSNNSTVKCLTCRISFNCGREYCVWHAETSSACYLSCPRLSSINVHHTVIINQKKKKIQAHMYPRSLHTNHVWRWREARLQQSRGAVLNNKCDEWRNYPRGMKKEECGAAFRQIMENTGEREEEVKCMTIHGLLAWGYSFTLRRGRMTEWKKDWVRQEATGQ